VSELIADGGAFRTAFRGAGIVRIARPVERDPTDSLGHHDANDAGTLALDAHRMVRNVGPTLGQEGGQDLDELTLVDRAAAQLEVDGT
jgi:hypothetical protein